ncbi:MAG: hypothetical protein IKK96_04915 [Lachnospiraceae bacterium]|nr:hypothetical protein [Lachnospiraceae bacterium]
MEKKYVDRCRFFRNRCYGIGQTVWTTITNLTGIMLAGKCVIVAGYGAKGKDIAETARAFGARVTVTEDSPIRAVEAVMDGFDVVTPDEAARFGDVFVTATDTAKVISEQAFVVMKDDAVLCNVGADGAIDTEYLEGVYIEKESAEDGVTSYELMNGRSLRVISDGKCLVSEVDELDRAVYELAAKKLEDKFPGDLDETENAGDIAEAEYMEQVINEAREEVARRVLRTLEVRI